MDESPDLLASAEPESNAPEMTVSELAGALKRTIEDAYGFVRVRGELGRVVVAKSGHVYFDIKDDKATINSVMWKAQAGRLPFRAEEGLEVVAEGRLSTYPARSNYQLICERMRPAGVGALMQLLEERRKKLAAEGLFAAERKKPIPYLPRVIGVVTSPTGAVIRDILHRVRERFPAHVLIWPALVQGERAAAEVEAGIRGFNALPADGPIPRPDVIIVARGGGSIEDLWPFNEERVVRAAADSAIPLISAVGHETDTTLIDYASDRRAPTPTGAAEMAVPVRSELVAAITELEARLARGLSRTVERRRLELRSVAARMPRQETVLQGPRQRLDIAAQRFASALDKMVARKRALFETRAARLQPSALRRETAVKRAEVMRLRDRLQPAMLRRLQEGRRMVDAQGRMLGSLSHEGVLARGFALVTRADGSLVRSVSAVAAGDALRLKLADGELSAVAGDAKTVAMRGKGKRAETRVEEPPPRPRIRKRGARTDDDPGDGGPQGDLF